MGEEDRTITYNEDVSPHLSTKRMEEVSSELTIWPVLFDSLKLRFFNTEGRESPICLILKAICVER